MNEDTLIQTFTLYHDVLFLNEGRMQTIFLNAIDCVCVL